MSDNTIRCWGKTSENQCDPLHRTFTNAIQVACGYSYSVVLLSDGTVRCWGDNSENQCDPVHLTFTNVQLPCSNTVLW